VLGTLSGIGTTADFLRTELPLLIMVYAGLYFLVRDSRYRAYIASLLLVAMYLAHDAHYSLYGNVLRLADTTELRELLGVLTIHEAGLYSLIILVPLSIYVASVEWMKGISFLILLAVLSLAPVARRGLTAAVVGSVNRFGTVTEWSDQYSVRDTGRLTMILYHEAKRRSVRSELSSFRDNAQYLALIDAHGSGHLFQGVHGAARRRAGKCPSGDLIQWTYLWSSQRAIAAACWP
jgi:hypothetical protein